MGTDFFAKLSINKDNIIIESHFDLNIVKTNPSKISSNLLLPLEYFIVNKFRIPDKLATAKQ